MLWHHQPGRALEVIKCLEQGRLKLALQVLCVAWDRLRWVFNYLWCYSFNSIGLSLQHLVLAAIMALNEPYCRGIGILMHAEADLLVCWLQTLLIHHDCGASVFILWLDMGCGCENGRPCMCLNLQGASTRPHRCEIPLKLERWWITRRVYLVLW